MHVGQPSRNFALAKQEVRYKESEAPRSFFFRDTNEIKGSFVASFTKYAYLHFAIRREEDRYRGKGEERAKLLFRLPRFLKLSFPSS